MMNMTTSVEYLFRFSHALLYTGSWTGIRIDEDSISEKKVEVESEDRALI
jgi:hypothetical protein